MSNEISFKVADEEYKSAFYSELEAFKERIKKRAAEKIAEAMEEERLANLGPGGLDPSDVFESLPRFSVSQCALKTRQSSGSGQCRSALNPKTLGCFNRSSRNCQRRRPGLCTTVLDKTFVDFFTCLQVSHEAMCGFWPLGAQQRGPWHQHRGRFCQGAG